MSGQIYLTSVIPTFCAIVITTPIGILISQLFGKEKHFTNSTLLEEFALNFLVGLGIDFIFAIFILPFMAIQNRAIQTTSSQALTINGKDLCLKNVHFLRASGHGTIIKSDDGETNFAEKFLTSFRVYQAKKVYLYIAVFGCLTRKFPILEHMIDARCAD